MKIRSNKIFDCYETAYESWKSGKDISLDGVKLIPITVLDEIRAEIVELTKCPYGTECLGANCPSNTDCMICGDHVLEILDKYKAESEDK